MMMTKTITFHHHHHHHSQTISFPPIYTITNSSTNTNPQSQNNKNREIEIRVCTNRTCRRQGSLQTLETLVGLAPPHVSIKPCGCLGRCGSGPNLVVLPDPVMVGHCGTAARAARLMVDICGGGGGGDDEVAMRSLEALSLRKRAEIELERENFSEAEALFSKVMEAKPIGGIHAAYKGRSAVRLLSGNFTGALDDANKALALYGQYAEAYICRGDAFLAMNQLEAAEISYTMGLESDPSLHRSKSFKARIKKLQEKMTSAAMS